MDVNYDYVLQENNYDCGIASLITVFRQFNKHVSKEEILSKINIKEGVSAYDLINVSNFYNISAKGLKGSIEKLEKEMVPCIAHIIVKNSYYHYVVILKNNKRCKKLIIMDPAKGIVEVSYDKFNEASTGIFIVFENKSIKRCSDNRLKMFLKEIFKDNRSYINKIILISITYIFISLVFSNYLKLIFNTNNILLVTIIFIVLSLLKNLILYLKNYVTYKLNIILDKTIHKRIITHIFSLPYKYFHQKTTGEYNILISDINIFKDAVIKIFVILFIDIFVILSVIIYTSFISILLVPIFIIFMIMLFFISKKYQYILNNNYKLLRSTNNKVFSYFINSLLAFSSIKGLHIEDKIIDKNIFTYKEVLNLTDKDNKYNNFYLYIENNIIDLIYVFIIFILIMLSRYKGLDISNVLLFSSVFNFALPFILDISSYLTISKIHKTSIDKVLDLLELQKEDLKTTRLTTIKKVEFKNINFSYDDTQLIKNFNYEYKKERLMIVGESGSGKSTLIKLLLRFLKLNEGEILIDNININYLDLDFIRSNITYVSQNEVLFNDTILNNLSIVNKDIGKIKKVCEIVRLKHDLNYLILDDASNISGGERKKIIIARALLKVKDILILDESFNEVGIDEEKKILTNIFDEYKNLGVIYISHRNSNKNLFDKTLCIGGKIARSRT